MNPALAQHLIEYLRREKPALRELPIPAYVERLLCEIEAAGFSIRKKSDKFTPSVDAHKRYLTRLDTWKANFDFKAFHEAFPHHDLPGELAKAHLWLVNHAGQGGYRTRFNQFFQNWLQRAKPTSVAVPPKPKTLGDERTELIAQGIRDLAASRSERLFPNEFELRLQVALRDLETIPTDCLVECFRRARLLELRMTPGVFHVLNAYKQYKAELRQQDEADQKKAVEAEKQITEKELAAMSPEQREEHARQVMAALQKANKGFKGV